MKLIICFLLVFITAFFLPKIAVRANINQVQTISNNNWKIINGNGVSLSLPPKYLGGDPAQDLDEFTAQLEKINPSLANRLQPIKQQDLKAINLLAFNSNIVGSNLIDNVNIVSQKNNNNLSLDQYILKQNKKQLFTDSQTDFQETITLKNNQIAKKIIAHFPQEKTTVKQLFYILEKSGKFWTITYTTSLDKFEKNFTIFEQSITTLNIGI